LGEGGGALGVDLDYPGGDGGGVTRLAVAIAGSVYAASAWALTVATGPGNIQAAAKAHGPQLIFDLVTPYLLAPLVQLGQLLFLTSLFAAALAFHATAARYLLALGREGVLPSWLGKASRRTGALARASLTHSVVAAASRRRPRRPGRGRLPAHAPARTCWPGSAMAPTLLYPSSPDQKGDLRVSHHPVIAVQPGLGIRPATTADLDRIVRTLADAFLDTPTRGGRYPTATPGTPSTPARVRRCPAAPCAGAT
jgi:hypothetical protein